MSKKVVDMTSGSPLKLMVAFMIPLVGSYFAQQLYTIVDSIIVGQGVGVEALAAVGSTDMLRNISVWGMAGLAEGFGIVLTIIYGSKEFQKLKECKTNAVVLAFAIAGLVAFAGAVFSGPLMSITDVPSHIRTEAQIYMVIVYLGCPAMTSYYISSAVLRALGNSRAPFVAIIISSIVNIGLDLIFVFVFKWGLVGAAVATVIAQATSGAYCFYIISQIDIVRREGKLRDILSKYWMKRLLAKGIPMGLQNAFIAIGGVILQSAINGLGVVIVAGFTATNKIYLLMEGAAMAIGGAVGIFTGQNMGAGNLKRIRQGVKSALILAAACCLIVSVLMIAFGKYILRLFIEVNSPDFDKILEVSYHYLFIICVLLFLLYLIHIYRQATMGLGNTLYPMISGVGEFFGRAGAAVVLMPLLGAEVLYYGEVLAFLGADIVLVPMFYKVMQGLEKRSVN